MKHFNAVQTFSFTVRMMLILYFYGKHSALVSHVCLWKAFLHTICGSTCYSLCVGVSSAGMSVSFSLHVVCLAYAIKLQRLTKKAEKPMSLYHHILKHVGHQAHWTLFLSSKAGASQSGTVGLLSDKVKSNFIYL